MRTRLLRPGWLFMHVLVVLALYGMLRLGIWQWGRGEATGGIRNYSYGLEWWAFVGLTFAGWVKFCLDETSVEHLAEKAAEREAADTQRAVDRGDVPAAAQPVVSVDDDPDLAAWNARFADLARRDAGSSS